MAKAQNTKPPVDISALKGSESQPATFEVAGKTISITEVIARAFDASGLTAEGWQGMEPTAREKAIADAKEEITAEIEKAAAEEEKAKAKTDNGKKNGKEVHVLTQNFGAVIDRVHHFWEKGTEFLIEEKAELVSLLYRIGAPIKRK